MEGLYDRQINHIAKQLHLTDLGYLHCVPRDKIHTLKNNLSPNSNFAFIYNTDPAGESGEHWIAVAYLSNTNELCHYDSYGEEPGPDISKQLQILLDSISAPLAKFKINRIPVQKDPHNCGHHCLLFLTKLLLLNIRFKDATGYTSDKDANNLKLKLKKFGYI